MGVFYHERLWCRRDSGITNLHCTSTTMKLRYVLGFLSLVHAMFMFYDLGRSVWEPKGIRLDWYSILLGRVEQNHSDSVWGNVGVLLGLYLCVRVGIGHGLNFHQSVSLSGKGC